MLNRTAMIRGGRRSDKAATRRPATGMPKAVPSLRGQPLSLAVGSLSCQNPRRWVGIVWFVPSGYTRSLVPDVEGRPGMRFHLLDRIDAHQPGKFLRGCKHLTLGEEYLADHFPRFPVMPGVLMLHTLVEAGAWLWRATTGYRPPVVVLREAKNVKYGSFMRPGRRMDIAVDLVQQADGRAVFKGKGTDDAGKTTVTAQFTLAGYGLADRSPIGAVAEAKLLESLRLRWAELTGELRSE